jgi:hypothetical protein
MASELDMREDRRLSEEFSLRLRVRLKNVLEHKELDLGEIVRECDGAYPTDVHEEIGWLIDNREVVLGADSKYKLASNSLPTATRAGSTQVVHSARSHVLPEPHPIDFDWRFTQQAIGTLLRQIEELVSPEDEVAILGAPTLFIALVSRGLNVWLFDRNTHLLDGLRKAGYVNLVNHDLFCRMPFSKKFAIVVADPPWYPEYYQAFVRAARTFLRCEGHLLLSVLPALTRPAAAVDRAALADLMTQCGFAEINRLEKALLYECPPFEMATLQSQGLYCGPWRSGDLAVYQLPKEQDEIDHLPQLTGDTTSWRTFALNQLVVKVRCRQPKDGAIFDFRPVSDDGSATLGSVSRRDPLRSLIDLWTSRNSAFKVSRSEILFELLHLMENNNSDPLSAVRQLYRLSEAEATKISHLIEWLTTESRS